MPTLISPPIGRHDSFPHTLTPSPDTPVPTSDTPVPTSDTPASGRYTPTLSLDTSRLHPNTPSADPETPSSGPGIHSSGPDTFSSYPDTPFSYAPANVVIFSGTTEGRELAEFCSRSWTPALVCVATDVGPSVMPDLRCVTYHVGRLDKDGMRELLGHVRPKIVVDATHPYATEVTNNCSAVCTELGLAYLRVKRPDTNSPSGNDVRTVPDIDAAVAWLNTTKGVIFATTGAKEAAALTSINDFHNRVVLRILPIAEGIRDCLDLGYPSSHLIAMQGPFSQDLNLAMFQHYGASILLTKSSGDAGGYSEKLAAARQYGMSCVVIARPGDVDGVSVEDAEPLITKAVLGG